MKNNLCQIGCVFLASPLGFVANAEPWRRHVIDDSYRGADGVRLADFNDDGLPDIVTGWEESGVVRLYLHPGYDEVTGVWPAVTVGKASSPEDALPIDLDGDQRLEILSCHEGKRLHYVRPVGSCQSIALRWTATEMMTLFSTTAKDRAAESHGLIDLDGDGDEDALICEERRNLGVIWYENPSNP